VHNRKLGAAVTWLIYDCDGVLVDSEVLAGAALAELMTGLGHPLTGAECIRIFGGLNVTDVLAKAEQILGRPVPPDRGEEAGQRLLARFRRELQPVNGVAAAIASLPHRRCVCSSSAPERLRLSLEVTALAPLFGKDVFSATQVRHGKPAPDLFLFAAGALGEAPSHAIVIEDSPLGIAAARAAGMHSIGFVGASHVAPDLRERLKAAGADLVVDAMVDLPGAIARLSGRKSHNRGRD
jgi:HAD superfamily hydrolase (TIGR01509 family)